MKESFVVNAEVRTLQGKGASRRLRATGQVPAIVYGGKGEAQNLTLSHNELWKHLKTEAFYSHILTLNVAGKGQKVVLKDLQRHPVNDYVRHADFLRVLDDVAIRMQVPLHFSGGENAPGVKVGGGIFEHQLSQVTVECLPKFLPEFIAVDLSKMELNDVTHLSQLTLPDGVALVDLKLKVKNDKPVVSLHLPRAVVEEEVVAPVAADVPAIAQKAPEAGAAAVGKDGKPAPAAAAGKDAPKADAKKK